MKKHLKTWAPWVILALVFYFLFKQIPPENVWKVAQNVNLPLFIFNALLYFFLAMLADCMGLRWAFSRFLTPINFSETFFMRGATYLLMLLNYNLGQGAMAVYLKRTHKIPAFKTLGTVFFLTLTDLSLMLGFGLLAMSLQPTVLRGIDLQPGAIRFAILFYSCVLLWVGFWIFSKKLTAVRKWKVARWFLENPVFTTFVDAKPMDYLKVVVLRIPMICIVISGIFLMLTSYSSSLSFLDLVSRTPVAMLLNTLPLTPAGLGTGQVIAVELYSPVLRSGLFERGFNASEIIVASTLFWMFANLLLKVLFGFFCLKKKSRSLFEDSPENP